MTLGLPGETDASDDHDADTCSNRTIERDNHKGNDDCSTKQDLS